MSKIGSTYHRIKMVSTDELHDSGHLILQVYGNKFKLPIDWEYLGEYDVVKVGNVNFQIAVDSVVSNSEFQLSTIGDGFKLIYAVENMTIEFKEVT